MPVRTSVNHLFDSVIKEVQKRIILQEGLDEIQLPPTENEYSKKKMGIDWKGTLILTGGKFKGLQTIHRVGEPTFNLSHVMYHGLPNIQMTFTADIGLTNPTISYDFQAIFMDREAQGVVTGTILDLVFTIILSVNMYNRKIRLVSCKFKDIGEIKTVITGLGLVFNFLATKIADIAVNKMKEEIAVGVEEELQTLLQEAFERIEWPMSDVPAFVLQHPKQIFKNIL